MLLIFNVIMGTMKVSPYYETLQDGKDGSREEIFGQEFCSVQKYPFHV